MEEQISAIFLQHYRLLALAGSSLLFLALVNRGFRTILLQTVTTVFLVGGMLISYALLTNQLTLPDLTEKHQTELAMTQPSRFASGHPLPYQAMQ